MKFEMYSEDTQASREENGKEGNTPSIAIAIAIGIRKGEWSQSSGLHPTPARTWVGHSFSYAAAP